MKNLLKIEEVALSLNDIYLQNLVVDQRNVLLALNFENVFLDLDLSHGLLSVGVRHCLRLLSEK